ncbi:SDR family NAD(P)-dependent oxidoreductase [Devosia ginsengisoli]
MRLESSEAKAVTADYSLADADGRCLLSIDGLEMRQVGQQATKTDAEAGKPAYYAETFIPFQPGEQAGLSGNWLILTSDSSATESLTAGLEQAGASVIALDLPTAAADEDLLSRTRTLTADAAAQVDSVIFHVSGDGIGEDDLVSRSEQHVLHLIAVAQALQALDTPRRVRDVIIVTHGARLLPQDKPMSLAGLAASAVVGLARTIASENPDIRIRQIDSPRDEIEDVVRILAAADSEESEFVLRGGASYVPRLVADSRSDLPGGLVDIDLTSATDNFQLTMKAPGSTASLFLEACPRPSLAPDDVLVETAAVGLNFRDVMAVTGLLPAGAEPDPAWLNLGLEFSGTVRALGSNVPELAVGARVMGMARACLRGLVAVPARTLVPIPSALSLEEAASIPSAFATAHYALAHAGRVQKGERVLIHLGSGGVGLAAIQVAKSLGAEVFATAGSEEKRSYLRSLGLAHVFNSRSLGFADDILTATGGKGVDVILNALPAHFIAKGLDVLAPFGRFLEIGKRDVYADTPLGLHGLRRNISVHVIDLAAMGTDRPDLLASILAEVLQRFADKVYIPTPITYFPVDRAADAFDLMARGRHIGKVVIGLESGARTVRASSNRALVARQNRSYLITGGTGGFGVEIARWLSRHGAGHLILASRSGTLPARHEGLAEELHASGSTVEAVALDLTDEAAVDAFIADRTHSDQPLAGIVHGAAVFKDGLLGQLDAASIRAVLQPKVAGAWALHRALAKSGAALDFFLSLSSVAQLLGSLGQANYVAANSFLDGFASYRAGHGMPAQTVSLGALGEAGFVADNAAMSSYLESLGILPMASADTLDLLEGLAVSSATSRSIAAVDWSRVRGAFGSQGVTPRLAGLMPGTRKGDHKLRQMLAASPSAAWPALLQEFLVEEVSCVLDVEPKLVPVNRPLAELGLDSLSSIELKNRIETRLGLTMTVGAFLQAPTLEKLSSVIASALEEQARSEREMPGGPGALPAAEQQAVFSDRQRWAIQRALAPMTSDAGRAALEQVARRRPDSPRALADIEEALSRLCSIAPHLALHCDPASRTLLMRGTPPDIVVTQSVADALARPLDITSGELLRIAASEENDVVVELGLRLHLAIDIEADSVLNALVSDDPGLIIRHEPPDIDRIAAEARTRALLEPWASAVKLPGGTRPVLASTAGLNIGRIVHRDVLQTSARLSEADWLLAFAQAVETVTGRRDLMIERFVDAEPSSFPVRVALAPDRSLALAIVNHQLSLSEPVLETCSMELLLAEELDLANVQARQLGFSFRDEHDPAIPAWNALAAHIVTFEGGTRVTLAYDEQAIDEANLQRLVTALANAPGQTANPVTPSPAIAALPNGSIDQKTARDLPATQPLPGYPVSAALTNLLDEVSDPAATETLRRASMLCQAIRVRPGVDVQRLQRAVSKVVDRHEFLRARFARHDGQWRALVLDRVAPLTVRDLDAAGDVELAQAMRSIAERPYDVSRPPLIEVHLLRLGAGGDVVLIRLFEGVADGWSLGVVLDDLIRAYIGLDLGRRPPGMSQILSLASHPVSSQVHRAGVRIDRLQLGPSRVRTLRLGLGGAEALRQQAATLGTTENGLLAASFAQALVATGHGTLPELGTYDPARGDPRLRRAVAFLSRMVQLDMPMDGNVAQVARQLDAQFLDLAAKPGILGAVPAFIYAPLLPRQMLDRSLFGPAMRQLSDGRVSVMSMEIEAIDIAPFGLQEGRLQLRPLSTHGGLELNFYYDIESFADADISALGRTLIALAGLPPSIVEGENLSAPLAASEDIEAPKHSLETT